MDQSTSKTETLVAARELYTQQLVNALLAPLLQGVSALEEEARSSSTPRTFLAALQEQCRRIPQWSQLTLDAEVKRIVRQTQPGFLDDLVPAIFLSNARILSSVSANGNASNINLRVPKLANFLHGVYVELARKIFKHVYLFSDSGTHRQRLAHKNDIEQLVVDAIHLALSKQLPVHDIIKACVLGHDSGVANTPERDSPVPVASELEPEPVADTDASADADPEPEPVADTDASADAAPEPEPVADTDASADAAPEPEPVADPDTDVSAVAAPEPERAPDTDVSADAAPAPERVADPDTDVSADAAPAPERVPDIDISADAAPAPERVADPDAAEAATTAGGGAAEIVIDVDLSDDECLKAPDDGDVRLSYDSDSPGTLLPQPQTPFVLRKDRAGPGGPEGSAAEASGGGGVVLPSPAEYTVASPSSATPVPDDTWPADASDAEMDFDFTDDELMTSDDEVDKLLYGLRAAASAREPAAAHDRAAMERRFESRRDEAIDPNAPDMYGEDSDGLDFVQAPPLARPSRRPTLLPDAASDSDA